MSQMSLAPALRQLFGPDMDTINQVCELEKEEEAAFVTTN